VNTLEKDEELVHQAGSRYQGNLVCPWGYGVVFSRITRQALRAKWGAIFEPQYVICQDEMPEAVDRALFQARLWDMFKYDFGQELTERQIDRIRWHLFPDIRITPKQLSFFDDFQPSRPQNTVAPNLMHVMDLQQERLARSLGEGHRVIHGAAGAGKTMILGYRCVHLARRYDKRILVLCFNVSLAAKLKQMIEDKRLSGRVDVYHFHGWCSYQLGRYHVSRPTPAPGEPYYDAMVQQVIDAVGRGQIPTGQYGAVLIDEGHDLEPEWLKLVALMVTPDTNALLLLYDSVQAIYGEKRRPRFSFASVGIQARGRTTILHLNYRNTTEILAVASEFAKEAFSPVAAASGPDLDSNAIVQPESAGRHGPVPELILLPSLLEEADYLATRLREMYQAGRPWNEMAIVYREKFIGEVLDERFRAAHIPIAWLQQSSATRFFHPHEPSIKIMTMHSSKGLEFPVVAIPGIGYMPNVNRNPQDEARLLYVAMTRAMDQLILTAHQDSAFAVRIRAACQRVSNTR